MGQFQPFGQVGLIPGVVRGAGRDGHLQALEGWVALGYGLGRIPCRGEHVLGSSFFESKMLPTF
jgi:hypothetical protein